MSDYPVEQNAIAPSQERYNAVRGMQNEAMPGTPMQLLPRNILIESLNHGYKVTVGCQSFAIENSSKLLVKLGEYLKNPQKVEKEWMDKKFEI